MDAPSPTGCSRCLNGWRTCYPGPVLTACHCDAGLARVLQGVRAFDPERDDETPPSHPRTNPYVRHKAVKGWREVAKARGIPEPEWLRKEPHRPPPKPAPSPVKVADKAAATVAAERFREVANQLGMKGEAVEPEPMEG